MRGCQEWSQVTFQIIRVVGVGVEGGGGVGLTADVDAAAFQFVDQVGSGFIGDVGVAPAAGVVGPLIPTGPFARQGRGFGWAGVWLFKHHQRCALHVVDVDNAAGGNRPAIDVGDRRSGVHGSGCCTRPPGWLGISGRGTRGVRGDSNRWDEVEDLSRGGDVTRYAYIRTCVL